MFVGVTPIKVATIWIRGTTKATDARDGVVDNMYGAFCKGRREQVKACVTDQSEVTMYKPG